MLGRRLIFGLLAMTLFGFSGLSSLMVQNQSKQAVQVRVNAPAIPHGRKAQDKTVSIDPGSEEQTIRWFVSGPGWIELEETFADGKVLRRKWIRSDYPPEMATGTSGGANFIVELSEGEAKLRDPNGYDKFRRNPQIYLFLGSVYLCPVILVITVILFMARGRKRKLAKPT